MNMFYTIGVILLTFLFIIIILIFKLNKIKKDRDKYKDINVKKIKEVFKERWSEEEKNFKLKKTELQIEEKEINGALSQLKTSLKEKEKRYEEVNQDLDRYKSDRMKEIDGAAAEYEQRKRLIVDKSVDNYREMVLEYANDEMAMTKEEIEKANEEKKRILQELEVERSKRAAVNEELRKAEEKERYNEIHSVQLTDNEKEDIHFLLSLENKLHNKQSLYKLVWSTYLQQAYKNTFHSILGNRDPRNVIYCIENINTGKKYIGKTSAEVSKRWTEHIKTSLNIGSVKSTNIHKALYNHWDEFIFYILTETEKEKLSEMEKYYIGFYESDKYGYNIKAGG